MKKTLFFVHSVGVIGGAERVTLATISDLRTEYQCMLLAPEEGALKEAAVDHGAQFLGIDCLQPELSKPLASLKQLWQYFLLFKKYRPALVHCGDLLAFRSLQPICKLLKVPMICHVHFPYQSAFMRWALKDRYAPAAFIFCSDELKQNLAPQLTEYCPHAQMVVIHNGIDTQKFVPPVGLNNPLPRVGIIANLQFRKGHDDFLAMAKQLIDDAHHVEFDIIGGDILQEPREPKLKALAKELGIGDKVHFHGQISDVKKALSSLDIFVCASHEEAFPISILEAMACARPIVSTDVNGITEMLNHDVNALLCQPFAPEQLAAAVASLLNDPHKAEQLGQRARESVVTQFSRDAFKHKMQSLYEELL
jgi:glycosyltransferase involved in cell wall biosynthesis